MEHRSEDSQETKETDLTSRRRWVPLRGMTGAPAVGRVREGFRRQGATADALDWLIIGGGIHGTYLSHFLTKALGVGHERLRVLDPHEVPLATWRHNTENVGMEYLRSAAVHHLDLASLSLKRYAAVARCFESTRERPATIAPYGRPLLCLFNEHSQRIIEENGLDRLRIRGRAEALKPIEGGYEVQYSSPSGGSRLRALRVMIAIGMDDATCWPDWAVRLRTAGMRVHHVLDSDFSRKELGPWRKAVVYGGGLSGAQISAALAERSPGTVTLVSGHEMEVHLFDSEPSWQGANFMSSFAAEPDPAARREIITRERHRGSLTPESREELLRLEKRGALDTVNVDSSELSGEPISDSDFRISTGGWRCEADLLILATGYDTKRPGGEWVERMVEELSLPCAPCGYPIVAPDLEWARRLFVSGPLAELELGPVARNISGAHRTAARLEYYLE